jgi:hypothetical protein
MSYRIVVARLSQLACHRLRLLQIEAHVHLAVNGRGGGEVLSGLLLSAGALIQLAEPKLECVECGDDPFRGRLQCSH